MALFEGRRAATRQSPHSLSEAARRTNTFSRIVEVSTSDTTKKEDHDVPPKPFRLLDLPSELWAKIGRHAIDAEDTYDLQFALSLAWGKNAICFTHQPAITRACKTLRGELLPVFYATKVKFYIMRSFTQDKERMKMAGRFFRAIGSENRRCIEGVELSGIPAWVADFQRWAREEDWLVPLVCAVKGYLWRVRFL